jgi:hypothetical protein
LTAGLADAPHQVLEACLGIAMDRGGEPPPALISPTGQGGVRREIIGVIVAGIIIGLFGTFVAPGDKDNIPIWLTVLCSHT